MTVKENIQALISRYVFQDAPAKSLSKYIIKKYKSRLRFFHNLSYLSGLWQMLDKYEKQLTHPDAVKFALVFHKIEVSNFSINKLTASNKKAEKTLKRLSLSQVDLEIIKNLLQKASEPWKYPNEDDPDTLFFMDLVRTPLGMESADYKSYLRKIRKESALMPSSLYKKKRKELILKLLSGNSLFHLREMKDRYEHNAQRNLEQELELYSAS